MWKGMAIFGGGALIIAVVLMAVYYQQRNAVGGGYNIKCVQPSEPTAAANSLTCEIDPRQNTNEGKAKPPWWNVLLAWPEGITAWLLLLTFGAIVWQAWETRNAAKATADSANAAYGSVTLAEAQWQMQKEKERARIEIKAELGLNLEEIGQGFWHLKATVRIRNLGATRAYVRRGAGELFVGKSWEETQPELDTWNSLGLDEDFIDPYSGKTLAVNKPFYFIPPSGATLAEYAAGIYEGSFPVRLYGVIEYETLGIHFRRNFGYTWLGDENPANVGAKLTLAPPAKNDDERIRFGFWRRDEKGNEEETISPN